LHKRQQTVSFHIASYLARALPGLSAPDSGMSCLDCPDVDGMGLE